MRGSLRTETVEPNDTTGTQRLVTTSKWSRGLKVSTTRTDGLGGWRKRVVHYDAEGVHPAATVNELNHVTRLGWYTGTGELANTTDPNLAVNQWDRDTFGRILNVSIAGTAVTHTTYSPSPTLTVSVNGRDVGLAEVVTTTTDGSKRVSRTYIDNSGRPVLYRSQGFQGEEVQRFTFDDVCGRREEETNVYEVPAIAADGTC